MIPGQWTRFRISFSLGNQGDGSYDLTVSNSAGETKQTLPLVNKDFKELTKIIFSSPDTTDGNYYLDAITIKTDDKN